jgi:hypothetical protein
MEEKPLSLVSALYYSCNPYSNTGYDRREKIKNLISKINYQIGCSIGKNDLGVEAKVRYTIDGYLTQEMLLELVVIYRKEGWTVEYGCETQPYLDFLIPKKLN